MNNFDTPWDFQITMNLNGYGIEYQNLTEISQGGPVVGTLYINSTVVDFGSSKFGGPLLFENPYIYIPTFVQKIYSTGFRLCKIELNSLKIELIGGIKELIFLSHIKDGYIILYEDAGKTKSTSEKM
jgi:hypothetical protein